jgi:hypothetical protein
MLHQGIRPASSYARTVEERTMTRARHAKPQTRTRAVRALFVAAAIAVAWVIGGLNGSGTYAAWSSTITIPGSTLHTGTAALQIGGAAQLTHTFTADSLSFAAPVTVTNSGNVALNRLSSSIVSPSPSPLAAAVHIGISVKSTTTCTVSTSTPSATLSAAPTNWLPASLKQGDVASYCVQLTISKNDLAANARATVSPTIRVSGTTGADGSGWSTAASGAFTLTDGAGPSDVIVGNSGTTVTVVTQTVGASTCYNVTVKSQSGWPVRWALTIYSTAPIFNGVAPSTWTWSGSNLDVTNDPSSGITTVTSSSWLYPYVSLGIDQSVTFCVGGTS